MVTKRYVGNQKFKSAPKLSCTKNWIAKYFTEHRISALIRLLKEASHVNHFNQCQYFRRWSSKGGSDP